mgnify:CR=1 FL=1
MKMDIYMFLIYAKTYMARTTLIIDDEILARVRKLASAEGRTLRDQVQTLLLEGMRSLAKTKKTKYSFDPPLTKGKTLDGIDIADRKTLYDLIEK